MLAADAHGGGGCGSHRFGSPKGKDREMNGMIVVAVAAVVLAAGYLL